MTENAFLRSLYAAARRHLDKAREAQEYALEFAIQQYDAGANGRDARRLYGLYDRTRAYHLNQAHAMRENARELRAQLRELEARGAA